MREMDLYRQNDCRIDQNYSFMNQPTNLQRHVQSLSILKGEVFTWEITVTKL